MKTKQITDISLRTFANVTDADTWLAQYAPADSAGNELVFNGLRYTNKEFGNQYEVEWTGSVWAWVVVPDYDPGDIIIPESVAGGANLFIIDSVGLTGALAEPTYDPEILAIDATATVVTSIKVDPREDTVDPNVQVQIQTDSGKEYVSDYMILDATNEDTSTGGLPVLATIDKTSMVFVGGSPINDRRFNGVTNFSSKPGGVEVTQIRVSGNGGFSLLIPINRAEPVTAPTSASGFTVESPGSGNHTHVRSGQTFTLDLHFNLTTLVNGSAQTDSTFPTVITLSGAGVSGTYNYTIPGGDRPAGGDFGVVTDFVVTVTAIPAATSGTDDNADANVLVKNAENVESASLSITALGETIQLDNTLISISGGVITYPVIPNTTRFGSLTQLALRTFDVPSRVGNINFTLNFGGVDVGTGSAYQIATQTGFSTSNSGINPISGSVDTAGAIDVTGIPASGASTISNAYIIQVVKTKNNSTASKNVSVRYQQNDTAITNGGIYEARANFNRDYTFNQTVLSAVIENSDDTAVVPNGVLASQSVAVKRRSVSINQYLTIRDTNTYELYAVGEAGEELLNSEVGATDNIVNAQGFTSITISVTSDHLVLPGTYNGIVVPQNSYELNLQDPTYVSSPQIPGGSVLTATTPANIVAGIASNPGDQEIYTNPGSQYIYVRNVAGTASDTINIEETV